MDGDPNLIFNGRAPYNTLDHKLGPTFNPNIAPTTDFADDLLRRTKILCDKTNENVMHSYNKFKKFYDKKAKASFLKEKCYCSYFNHFVTSVGQKVLINNN